MRAQFSSAHDRTLDPSAASTARISPPLTTATMPPLDRSTAQSFSLHCQHNHRTGRNRTHHHHNNNE